MPDTEHTTTSTPWLRMSGTTTRFWPLLTRSAALILFCWAAWIGSSFIYHSFTLPYLDRIFGTSEGIQGIIDLPNGDAVLASSIVSVKLFVDSNWSMGEERFIVDGYSVNVYDTARSRIETTDRAEAEAWRDGIIAAWKLAECGGS